MPDPDTTTAKPPRPILPLPDEGYGSFDYWQSEVKAAAAKRDEDYKPNWDSNIKSYQAKGQASWRDAQDKGVIVPKDFANVEQKKAQLFFQLPSIIAKPLRPDAEDSAPLAQAILRFHLGPQRVDAMKMMGECLFDALCPAGLMASKIGYESIQDGIALVTVQMPAPPELTGAGPTPLGAAPQPGQLQQPGNILGLNEPQPPATIPVQRPVPRIISERYFWERISPAKLLIPDGFSGSNYDLAPWMGYEFDEIAAITNQKYKLADGDAAIMAGEDEHKLASENQTAPRSQNEKTRGVEIWYKAALYDPNEKHPDKIRYMVILEGRDEPVRHEDSPYQRFDPQTGRLTKGMRGFPVQVGALRYVSDSAYPPSECTISRQLVDELSRFRSQMITHRDRAVSQLLVDMARIGGPAAIEKLRKGVLDGIIPVASLDVSNPPMLEAQKAHLNQDSYRANDYIDRDISAVWAMGENQRGQEAQESRTATEMQIASRAASTRLSAERREAMDYFAKGCTKLLSLLQLFADREEFIEIVGSDGARRLEAWDKSQIASEYMLEIKPDSAAQIDFAQERLDLLKLYELVARDPNVNRVEILHRLAQAFNYDPTRLIVQQLPPKGPDQHSLALSFKIEDLDIGNPMFPIQMTLIQQMGFKIDPNLIAQVQQHKQLQTLTMLHAGVGGDGLAPAGGAPAVPRPPDTTHPGTAPRAERLSKHLDRMTNDTGGPKLS